MNQYENILNVIKKGARENEKLRRKLLLYQADKNLDRGNASQHLNAAAQTALISKSMFLRPKISLKKPPLLLQQPAWGKNAHIPPPCECCYSSWSQEVSVSWGLHFCFPHQVSGCDCFPPVKGICLVAIVLWWCEASKFMGGGLLIGQDIEL